MRARRALRPSRRWFTVTGHHHLAYHQLDGVRLVVVRAEPRVRLRDVGRGALVVLAGVPLGIVAALALMWVVWVALNSVGLDAVAAITGIR